MKLVILLVLSVFQLAEEQCPSLPKGLLQAVSFTNTQCHHLTDADYTFPADDPTAMPRAYGMMGLVRDGKGCFRENLMTVAALSGYPVEEILNDPAVNVLAYAKACEKTASRLGITSKAPEAWMPVIMALSELPWGEKKDELPMKIMLYSVYYQLDVNLKTLFGDDYAWLSGESVSVSKETDYPNAIWIPAAECNYENRTKEVSAVVIHYTEGSYAGCISWFQNCDAEVSAHYVIRSVDGQVAQMVRECYKAWHAGTANGYTIGVEHEAYGDIISFFTEAMYQSSADLMRNICSRYDVIDGLRTFCTDTLDNGTALNTGVHNLGGEGTCLKIKGHQHYPDQTHTDPGPYWDWNYYYKLINEGTFAVHLGGAGVTEGDFNHEYYGNDERRIWVIESDPNTTITLNFSSFDLEDDYDFLWIYDGGDVYAPKIGRWNTQSPGSVTSTGNTMCVEFRSDCLTTAVGWQAHWTVHSGSGVDEWRNLVTDDCEITVFDLMGRTVMDQEPLPHGVYIVRYTRLKDGKTFVRRIIR
ncbi:MAG: N-acetylmuramoyl-L-alanine amidase [Bacteroidales bacterium]|nr:N-acetylmuramoyl-L-alanine amidase [Bacteroidales bacterium]